MPEPTVQAAAPHPPDAFEFGRNWSRFLQHVDEARIAAAVDSLARRFGTGGLHGKRFLDAGCGSGLFSLAAHRLGARVVSFDVDRESVACTDEMRTRFGRNAGDWEILAGSVLDEAFVRSLGEFDAVYSWGVLHHTGDMWRAIDIVRQAVAPGGKLWIAIYNDQGGISDRWMRVKRLHQLCPRPLRMPYVIAVAGIWAAWRVLCRRIPIALAGLLLKPVPVGRRPAPPFRDAGSPAVPQRAARQRGMHWWYDLVDWIGGWPFEVATPEQVLLFLKARDFELVDMLTCGGGLGCNEYVFVRSRSEFRGSAANGTRS